MAVAWAGAKSLPPSSLTIDSTAPRCLFYSARLVTTGQPPSHRWRQRPAAGRMRPHFSRKSPERQEQKEAAKDGASLSSDDSNYLWKLALGSVGGASAVKYGSILFPDITRPNIVQALLMVSLPVAVAVLILLKESLKETQDEGFM